MSAKLLHWNPMDPINDPNYATNYMSDHANFGSSDSPDCTQPRYDDNQANFDHLFDQFFDFDNWLEENPMSMFSGYTQSPHHAEIQVVHAAGISNLQNEGHSSREVTGCSKEKKQMREKIAFKTKSEVEILDDGFKWRKYGKKMVKNSPNPRNYYRCSIEGCPVKKRVERDKEDPMYVITTYEGTHNHQGAQY